MTKLPIVYKTCIMTLLIMLLICTNMYKNNIDECNDYNQ